MRRSAGGQRRSRAKGTTAEGGARDEREEKGRRKGGEREMKGRRKGGEREEKGEKGRGNREQKDGGREIGGT